MIAAANAPDAALVSWARALPAVRCAAAMLNPWTNRQDATSVPVSPTAHFYDAAFAPTSGPSTKLAGGMGDSGYWLAVVPAEHAVELSSGGGETEESFEAVIGESTPPPRAVVSLRKSPRTRNGLGLGSTRAEVERALGPGRAVVACGTGVVRYRADPLRISEAQAWFVYRNDRVIAFSHWEAV